MFIESTTRENSMSVLDAVLRVLKKEEDRLDRELSGITAAIAAFRETYINSKGAPSLSAARRTRSATASKMRPTKAQKKRKVVPITSKRTLSAAAGKKTPPAHRTRSGKVKAAKKSA
jgi:hypothetical protein